LEQPQPIRIEDEVQFIDPKRVKISRNPFEELVVELPDGTVHTDVALARAFPLTLPDQFIILLDKDDKEEFGVIEELKQLKKGDRKILEEELEKCYFIPKIQKIHSLTGHFGVTQWDVETDRGPAQFDLRSRYDIVPLEGGRVIIKDVDGNRYEIVNYHRLDEKSIVLIETQI
jgi:hypothetical protein